MTDRSALINQSLARVTALVGDPTDRIYARLFAEHPEFEPLFVMDTDGGVRANMLTSSFTCLLGVVEGNSQPHMHLEAARVHHDGYGLGAKEIDVMFEIMRDECRHILGTEWTDQVEAAWASLLAELSGIGLEVEG